MVLRNIAATWDERLAVPIRLRTFVLSGVERLLFATKKLKHVGAKVVLLPISRRATADGVELPALGGDRVGQEDVVFIGASTAATCDRKSVDA